jgi:polysaccharide pyruvyl transferase WcaK-like protein
MKIAVYLITEPNNLGDYLQQFLTAKLLSMHYKESEICWMINGLKPPDSGSFPMKRHWDMGYFARYDLGVLCGHSTGLATRPGWKRMYPLVRRSSKKCMIFPITVSKKTDEKVRSELKILLSGFSKVYARGHLTYDLLHNDLGLENVDVALDTGFALRIVYPEVRARENDGSPRVAVVPRKEFVNNPKRYTLYLERLKESIDFLNRRYNAQVDLLPFSHGTRLSDEDAADDLYRSGAAIRNIVKVSRYSIYDSYKIMAQYDYVITSRMHAAIMAMSAGIPSLMLFSSLTEKVIDVLDYLGLDKETFLFSIFSAESLVNKLEQLVENRQKLRQVIDNTVSQKCRDSLKPLEFQLVQ